jgi:uncharacterized protein DUF2829
MNFQEAFNLLINGKFVTRNGWEAGRYLVLLPMMPSIWMCATVPNPAAGNWQPLVQDLAADDWKLLDAEVPSVAIGESNPAELKEAA